MKTSSESVMSEEIDEATDTDRLYAELSRVIKHLDETDSWSLRLIYGIGGDLIGQTGRIDLIFGV